MKRWLMQTGWEWGDCLAVVIVLLIVFLTIK